MKPNSSENQSKIYYAHNIFKRSWTTKAKMKNHINIKLSREETQAKIKFLAVIAGTTGPFQ